MPVESFKFVSPGVFVNEIDNSQIPATPVGVGPTIIGRFQKVQQCAQFALDRSQNLLIYLAHQ